mgnify:CR=1 FL=1
MKYKIRDLCDTISATFDKTKEKVVLINTSDVLEGNVLNHELVINENIKGQFKKTFQTNDILYSEIRPKNKRFAFVDFESEDYVASTKLMVLRANKKILPEFLFQLLKSDLIIQQLQDLAETRSGTFPQITFYELGQIDVDIPDINEQKIISEYIMKYDEKIENNKKINHHLAEIAKSIFDSYFIDLSPYDGVMPDDWQLSNLTGIANYLNGLAMQKHRPQSNEQGLPVLKIKELRQGFTDSTSDLCSSNIRRDYIIHDGDVIFSWSGSLLVDFWTGGDCGLNQHLFKVSSETYDKWFYYAWTKHHLDRFVKIAADRATTMGHIKRDALEKAEVLIPSDEDFEEIGKMLKPIYDQILNNRVESRKLVALRDNLLPKLMSGEISVT